MDIEKILTEGIIFKGAKSPAAKKEEKVKTKAKKKTYITGLHNSFRSCKDESRDTSSQSKSS